MVHTLCFTLVYLIVPGTQFDRTSWDDPVRTTQYVSPGGPPSPVTSNGLAVTSGHEVIK